MKKSLKILTTLLTIFFFASSILLLIMGTMAVQQNRYLRIFNHSYSVVGSGSMEPTIMTGEFIIIKYVSYDSVYEDVLNGEEPIIAFKTDKNIVHRAIAVEDGKIITKGDNNPSRDEGFVDETNFIGVVTTHFMLLDLGNITLNYKNIVFIFIIGILLFILIHEFLNIISIIKQKNEAKMLEAHEQEKAAWMIAEKERLRAELEAEIKTKHDKKGNQ